MAGKRYNSTRWLVGRKVRDEIMRLYGEGLSQEQISRRVGRSKMTIQNVITRGYAGIETYHDEHMRRTIIYPGLREWFIDAGATLAEAAEVCETSTTTMAEWLHGGAHGNRTEPMRKWCIDRLLAWTGLTYEQAFAMRAEEAGE